MARDNTTGGARYTNKFGVEMSEYDILPIGTHNAILYLKHVLSVVSSGAIVVMGMCLWKRRGRHWWALISLASLIQLVRLIPIWMHTGVFPLFIARQWYPEEVIDGIPTTTTTSVITSDATARHGVSQVAINC